MLIPPFGSHEGGRSHAIRRDGTHRRAVWTSYLIDHAHSSGRASAWTSLQYGSVQATMFGEWRISSSTSQSLGKRRSHRITSTGYFASAS